MQKLLAMAIAALSAVAAFGSEPIMKIGFLTDTHIGYSTAVNEKTWAALEFFRDKGVDAVVHGGDLANTHEAAQYQAYRAKFNEIFAGQTPPTEIQAYGNHSYFKPGGGEYNRAEAYENKRVELGASNAHTAQIEFRGYTFLVMPYAGAIGMNGFITWAQYDQIVADACAANPGKPVFIVEHEPPQNTVYNTLEWGHSQIRTILNKYPQVVELSGHVHGSLRNDLYIWQGEFTVVNGGGLQHWTGLLNGAAASDLKDSNDVLILEVYADKIVARRWDVLDGHEIAANDPWTIPLPFDAATAPYNWETRKANEPVPAFGATDELTVEVEPTSAGALRCNFPQVANHTMTYRIVAKAQDANEVWQTVAHTEIFSDYWMEDADRGQPVSTLLVSDDLESSVEYKIEVRPVNQYGVEGQPLSVLFTTPADFVDHEPPSAYLESVSSDGSVYIDTRVIGRAGTKIEADFEYLALGGDLAFMGSRASSSTDSRVFPFHTTSSRAALGYGKFIYADPTVTLSPNVKYHLVSDLGVNSQTVSIDGRQIYSGANTSAIDTGLNLFLFADNIAGSAKYASKIRLYSLKIYQTDDRGDYQLVRDFKPCMKEKQAALFDAVESRTYRARQVSTGVTAGLTIPAAFAQRVSGKPDSFVEYIECGKTQILDTGVPARTGVKVRGKMRWTNYWEGWACYLGAENGVSKQFFMMNRHNANAWAGYGSSVGGIQVDDTQLVYDGQDYQFTADYSDPANVSLVLNGEKVLELESTESFDTGYNLTLFGARGAGSFNYIYPARCYGLTIWLDGKAVREFKPCVKDGKGALYDRIHDEIVFPTGDLTGSLIGPEVVDRSYAVTEFAEPDYFVEYLQTDNKQVLDTGVPSRTGVKAEGKMQWFNAWSGWVCFLGAEYGSGAYFHMFFRQASNAYFDYGNKSNAVQPGGTQLTFASSPTTYEFVSDFSDSSAINLTINGTEVFRGSYSGSVDARHNLTLFGCPTGANGAMSYNGQPMRCYYLKLWLDGDLVRDFKPCVKNGKGAMYDCVLGEIVYPTGDITGTAIGPEVEDPDANYMKCAVEYVESDGTQFVDTLIKGKSGLKMEADVEWTYSTSSTDIALCGSRSGDTRYFLFHNYCGTMSYGYGVWKGTNVKFGQDERHVFTSVMDVGAQNLWKDGTGVWSGTDATAIDTGLNLYLFAHNIDGTAKNFSKVKCYGFKLWQKDGSGDFKLVRDFRPYRVIRPGVDEFGAFYDRVSGKFFRGHNSSGAISDLKAGPNRGLRLIVR